MIRADRSASQTMQQVNPDKPERWKQNRHHWEQTLDAQNLGAGPNTAELERQLSLYLTADVEEALDLLEPLGGATVLELGGGLGLMAILLARRGANVIVADLSLPRLQLAGKMAEEAGVRERVRFVLCTGESLPFLSGSLNRQTTKSVLIHTQLGETAAELDRTLAGGGVAVFIEPLDGHPLVNLYRRLAAPKIWQEITDYFNQNRLDELTDPFEKSGAAIDTRRRYFLAFLASPLNYSLRMPRLYRLAEKTLLAVDHLLWFTKRYCWFAIVRVRK